ncbi:hypothetical protein BC940DRAFT_88667 [Gongronella butleri]|nr:hypothetical protein BC940DRAFT_88667 [Gongronella butleri]
MVVVRARSFFLSFASSCLSPYFFFQINLFILPSHATPNASLSCRPSCLLLDVSASFLGKTPNGPYMQDLRLKQASDQGKRPKPDVVTRLGRANVPAIRVFFYYVSPIHTSIALNSTILVLPRVLLILHLLLLYV